MKNPFNSVLICFVFLVFTPTFYTQEKLNITILEIIEIKSFPIVHMAKYADRKVTYQFLNTSQNKVTVFGSEHEEEFKPIRYLLRFNKSQDKWEYPTPNGEPVKWNGVSKLHKKERILNPGEFITFINYYSSETDCGQLYKISIQIEVGNSKRTQELLSDSYETEPCE